MSNRSHSWRALCVCISLLVCLCAVEVSATFVVNCNAAITVQRLDPIVAPGVLSSHIHMVVGASAFNATATSASLRASQCNTCQMQQDNSAYWIPELFYHHRDGTWEQLEDQLGGSLAIYYIQRANYNGDTTVYGIPQGLRMIAGTPTLKTYTNDFAQNAISYLCVNYNQNRPTTYAIPPYNCPQMMRAQIFFPSCWDGVNLDSADHKSHMAYPDGLDGGNCPATHPKRIISLFYERYFSVGRFAADWLDQFGRPARAQPYYFSTGDNTGYSLHGDFLDGWNTTIIDLATQNCVGAGYVCPYFTYNDPEENQACLSEYPPFSNEVTTGILPGNLPGMAGYIPEAPFNPCMPSPNAPYDGTGVGDLLNSRLCFESTPNATSPWIGLPPTGTPCTSQTCMFIDIGATTATAAAVPLAGEGSFVTLAADVYPLTQTTNPSQFNQAIVNAGELASEWVQVYQTYMWGSPMYYNLSARAGDYVLRLGFCENTVNAVGQRVFDIIVNGQTLVPNFDIFALAGEQNLAVNITVPFTVTTNTGSYYDNSAYVIFSATQNWAIVSWMTITPAVVDAEIFGGANANY